MSASENSHEPDRITVGLAKSWNAGLEANRRDEEVEVGGDLRDGSGLRSKSRPS